MKDLLLDATGDLVFENGDVIVTDSVVQAIKVRLRWFAGEWRINTEYGMPYYEDVFVKSPNKILLEERVREEIMTVDEVQEVQSVTIDIDTKTRTATIKFTAVVNEQVITEEVIANV